MELTPLHVAVLQVLNTQSPGYLCDSKASAFVSIGLDDSSAVEKAIQELSDAGYTNYVETKSTFQVMRVKLTEGGQIETDKANHPIPDLDEKDQLQWDDVEVLDDNGWTITPIGVTALEAIK